MKTFEQLLKDSRFTFVEKNNVIICNKCCGTGSYTTEECVDYHKDEYETTRHKCNMCKGDGRMVELTRTINVQMDRDSERVSYVDFTQDPYYYSSTHMRLRVDYSSAYMEKKYPKLKELSYDSYDKLMHDYLLVEQLKKEHTK